MSIELFGIDIAGIVDDNISDGVLPATLTKVTDGTRDSNNLAGGLNPVETPYSARGFIDSYTDDQINNTTILRNDRQITLIGNSIEGLQIPATGDIITIEGSAFDIINVTRDPAAATYVCQAR